jgi:glycosyltransferase involved in cell wall biosynthesis
MIFPNCPFMFSFFSLLFNRNVKFISGSRGYVAFHSKLFKKIDDYIIRHSFALISNSHENLEYLKKISSDPSMSNGYVLQNGLDVLPENRIKIKREKHSITIGIIALFKEVKNYPLFIDLCKSITDLYSNVNFSAIGTGPEFDTMVSYAKSKNLDLKLRFKGNRFDATEIMSNEFDIFVLTSIREGLSNMIMEAMSFGLPVVATDVGDVSELVKHQGTGFLVPSGDLDGLVKYCKILIYDLDLRTEMGQKGRYFITQNYSSEKMVKEFENIFKLFL